MRRCCIADRGTPAAGRDDLESAESTALLALRPTQLRRRALELDCDQEKVDAAEDSDKPKAALVALIQAATRATAAEASVALTELRRELTRLKRSELRRRAQAARVDDVRLEEAEDCEDPAEALALIVDLICEQATQDGAAPQPSEVGLQTGAGLDHAVQEARRRELNGMKLSALRQRAEATDIAAAQAAEDSDDPKRALVDLLLAAATPRQDGDRPHFGTGQPAPPEPQLTPAETDRTKHVMLSYQWDHQAQVKRAHDMLARLGVKCWMDISGGMGADIYESMADGVSNASVVVCFMSQKYQESENCMLVR
jgi:hypothetical protein